MEDFFIRHPTILYCLIKLSSRALNIPHPVDIASMLKVPGLGLYGGKDTGIPLKTVNQIRDRLKSSNSKSEIIVYPDAPYAFFADYRPSYQETEAKQGLHRLQEWFKEYGV